MRRRNRSNCVRMSAHSKHVAAAASPLRSQSTASSSSACWSSSPCTYRQGTVHMCAWRALGVVWLKGVTSKQGRRGVGGDAGRATLVCTLCCGSLALALFSIQPLVSLPPPNTLPGLRSQLRALTSFQGGVADWSADAAAGVTHRAHRVDCALGGRQRQRPRVSGAAIAGRTAPPLAPQLGNRLCPSSTPVDPLLVYVSTAQTLTKVEPCHST